MKLLATLPVGSRKIELLQGDLTLPDPAHPFDLLVVSAFPNDYLPTPGSLIGALHRSGISVAELALHRELDLRTHFSCWLSGDPAPAGGAYRPTTAAEPALAPPPFKRLLCFEPLVRGDPPEVVGDIFRALAPILGERTDLRSVAMPIVAAGDQRWPVAAMLRPLLDAAIHWMRGGLPLDTLKIVAHGDTQVREATEVFALARSAAAADTAAAQTDEDFDVFLSYAREDSALVDDLAQRLRHKAPAIRIFLDRKNINVGTAWQPEIFESLDRCRKVVALFSPDYLASKVCKEEFNIAWARSRDCDREILFPIYLFTAKLPTYMSYRAYFDCREGDAARLEGACDALLAALAPGL